MAEAKLLHRGLRRLASWAVWSFFSEIAIIGGENVPEDGPLIVAATHHNMMLDPAVLSTQFPHGRILNYWTKATLFANKFAAWVLLSSGNIPVDRKSKDNQVLFRGTFEALSRGEAVALFPEGTSYTEPAIMQVKDGASWAGLEYTKWAGQNPEKATVQELKIVPVGIVYTNKSKYRSRVLLQFGRPISMSEYAGQFLSPVPGEARASVKKLTARIESDLVRFTVNAPDWDTLYAARMARDLLWEKDNSILLADFVPVTQTLVDLFATPDAAPNMVHVRRRLLEYYSLLKTSKLTHAALADLPLPRNLSPHVIVPLPSRLRTLMILIRDTIAVLIRLPFFAFPLLVHLPAYAAARWAGRLVEHEEETMAQNKVVFGLVLLLFIYPVVFYFLWALFLYTWIGVLVAAGTVWLFAVYHVKLIDDNYESAKRLVAAWRVLVGVWVPRKWDLSMTALKPYTVPETPPENPWIDRSRSHQAGSPHLSPTPKLSSRAPSSSKLPPAPSSPPQASSSSSTPKLADASNETKAATEKRKKKPPTRRVIKHVLRARVEAARALASFLHSLSVEPRDKRVLAADHLASLYGGFTDITPEPSPSPDPAEDATPPPQRQGYRLAHEVIQFLRDHGANISRLQATIADDYWASALGSDGEYESGSEGDVSKSAGKENDDLVWIAPMVQTH